MKNHNHKEYFALLDENHPFGFYADGKQLNKGNYYRALQMHRKAVSYIENYKDIFRDNKYKLNANALLTQLLIGYSIGHLQKYNAYDEDDMKFYEKHYGKQHVGQDYDIMEQCGIKGFVDNKKNIATFFCFAGEYIIKYYPDGLYVLSNKTGIGNEYKFKMKTDLFNIRNEVLVITFMCLLVTQYKN